MKLRERFGMTDREYKANVQGIHTLFGAVLGFVLARVEDYSTYQFALVLLFTSGVVVGIYYVTASERRWAYIIFSACCIAILPIVLDQVLGKGAQIPQKLQPTLAVWLFMSAMIALSPRKPDAPAGPVRAQG